MTNRSNDYEAEGQEGRAAEYWVDTRGSRGVQVGDSNFQANYNFLTWTDGVALPPLASVSGIVTSPYRGLGSFEERDAAFFFGRDDAAAEVLGRMSRLTGGQGVLMVSGASGAGKSSLLRAGVLPRLRRAGLAGIPSAASWPCLVFAPGRSPLDELAVRVAPLAGADAAEIRRGLATAPEGFALTARQAALARPTESAADHVNATVQHGEEGRLLLVVDQFEQLFTRCEDEGERSAFITALHAAADDTRGGGPAALVVVGVRADFEVRCAAYPELAQVVQDRYLLPVMSGRQLRVAITAPPRVMGAHVDDELADVLLSEVRARQSGDTGAGVLPLLSYALDQAWRSRSAQDLTLADYERTGGIEAAVTAGAERAYHNLTPGQQRAARQVFTRLVITTTDGIDTAARARQAELTGGRGDARVAEVEAVLEAFAAERLLTLATDSVEISHEALLTAWPMLQGWLAETRADRVVLTHMRATAEEWNLRHRDSSYLYSGSRLDIAAEAFGRISADARHGPTGQAEGDFLAASRRAASRRTRLRRAYTAVLMTLVVGLTATTIKASQDSSAAARASQAATQQRNIAISSESGELASESEADTTDVTLSRLESLAAWTVHPTPEARYAMQRAAASPEIDTLSPGSGSVDSVAFSPDGKILATGDFNGTVDLWNLATRQQVANLHAGSGSVESIAFSADGEMFAAGGTSGTVRLWRLHDSAALIPTVRSFSVGVGIPALSVAFSPDGATLAVADGNGTVQLWSVATGRQARVSTGSGIVNSVAFSPDGKTLAAGGDNGIMMWNLSKGQQIRRLGIGSSSGLTYSVAFSPDGKALAAAGTNGSVELWNVASRHLVRSLDIGSGLTYSIAFSPDGKALAAGGDNGIMMWNLVTGQQSDNLATDLGPVDSVTFAPSGETLASGDNDGTARLWDATGGQILSLHFGAALAGPVVFSPDGKTLAVAGTNGSVELWNVASRHLVRSLDIGSGLTYSIAFSPDGKTLAVGDGGSSVSLWNVANGQQFRSLDIGSGLVYSVAFSPVDETLAVGDGGGRVTIWDLRDPAAPTLIRQPFSASIGTPENMVAFSPDGKTLATGGANGTVELWDTATGRQTHSLNTDYGAPVSFSPDGTALATPGNGGAIELWNLATEKKIISLGNDFGDISSVTFSRQGTMLAVSYTVAYSSGVLGDSYTSVWNTSYLADTQARLCGQTGRSLSRTEWGKYVPDVSYQDVCPRTTN